MNCQQCNRCLTCAARRAAWNEGSCIRLLPGARSEALNRGQNSCTGSRIVFRCGCR